MGSLCQPQPPSLGREEPGAVLTPQVPGHSLEARGGRFLLGRLPRPFHNEGKSAGLRVLGYCSLQPLSDPLGRMSQAPSDVWGKETLQEGRRGWRLGRVHWQCCMNPAPGVGSGGSLAGAHLQAFIVPEARILSAGTAVVPSGQTHTRSLTVSKGLPGSSEDQQARTRRQGPGQLPV